MKCSLLMGASLVCLLLAACPADEYSGLADATEATQQAARQLWSQYLEALTSRDLDSKPELAARFFSPGLIARLEVDEFSKALQAARRKRGAGLFEGVEVASVKLAEDGPWMVIDSKAGRVGIPLSAQQEQLRFASLEAAVGEWTQKATRAPTGLPEQPSLLFIKSLLADEQAPIGARLRAAVGLAQSRYRKEILQAQKTVADPVVRLGLGLARIKIDGSDDSFILQFPAEPAKLLALQKADPEIFEEMVTKLTNLASMVEDPAANESLYRATAGAPDTLRARFGRALYEMAEANPRRFANAVFSLAKDLDADPGLAAYFAQVQQSGNRAPNVQQFLRKFASSGEGAERKLCKSLQDQFQKRR